MRQVLIVIALILGLGAGLACFAFPAGAARLRDDAVRDLRTGAVAALVHDTAHDLNHIADSVLGAPSVSPVAPGAPAPPAAAAWKAPAVFPAKPNWTWTTISGDVYQNVKVVGMEQNSVTIIYDGGGRHLAVADLGASLQAELGYDPALYAADTALREQAAEAGAERVAASGAWEFDDYDQGVAQARASGKRLLLLFTGSDWCPWCIKMHQELLSTQQFRQYAAAHYIMVTLDFLHNTPQPDSVKQQHDELARKYNITGYPTLLVVDLKGQVQRTLGGYPEDGIGDLMRTIDVTGLPPP